MALVDPAPTNFDVDTVMEIKVEDFRTSTSPKHISSKYEKNDEYWDFRFLAYVYPDEINKCNKRCVKVLVDKVIFSKFPVHYDDNLTWTVSIIDIEGNMRMPQSFTICSFGNKNLGADDNDMTYLERSVILNRPEEFLPNGTLTLHIDISYSWNTKTSLLLDLRELTPTETSSAAKPYLNDFLSKIPSATMFKNEASKVIPNSLPRIFDFSYQILTLSPLHELRKHFDVVGITPKLWHLDFESKIDPAKVMEHVWIFDTNPDRFFISLEEGKNGFGPKLLEVSDVIKRCVNAPMREQQNKRIVLSSVKSRTFVIVLYYLTSGSLIFSNFSELMDVYEMSHSFGMHELFKKCAEHMVSSFNLPSVAKLLKSIANFYSDEYLLKLLLSRCREYQKGGQISRSDINSRPDFDCFV